MATKKTSPKKSASKKPAEKKSSSKSKKAESSEQSIPTLPLAILAQYVKDLSFETPGPLALATDSKNPPEISLDIEVGANAAGENRYEVELHVRASATKDKKEAFIFELTYAGIFAVQGIEEKNIPPVLLIECPRLLFPFARSIVAETTREGGFPPLALAPVDFASIYRQKVQESQAAQS